MRTRFSKLILPLALAGLVLAAASGAASASPRPTIPPAALKAPPLRQA